MIRAEALARFRDGLSNIGVGKNAARSSFNDYTSTTALLGDIAIAIGSHD